MRKVPVSQLGPYAGTERWCIVSSGEYGASLSYYMLDRVDPIANGMYEIQVTQIGYDENGHMHVHGMQKWPSTPAYENILCSMTEVRMAFGLEPYPIGIQIKMKDGRGTLRRIHGANVVVDQGHTVVYYDLGDQALYIGDQFTPISK